MKKDALLLLVVFSIGNVPCASDAAPSNKSANTKSQNPRYSTEPLEPSTEVLPRSYSGHSCNTVAKKISSFKPVKDEYETTADYKNRLAGLEHGHLIGNTSARDIVGFVQAPGLYSGLTQNYNADLGILMVRKYSAMKSQLIGGQLLISELIEQKMKGSRDYIGSNAYGKKVSVSATHWSVCAVAFSNLTYRNTLASNPLQFNVALVMPAEEARSAKENLTVMYVGKISEPYLGEYTDYSKPTLDQPTEISMSGDAVVLDLTHIWLFDRQTGKVYQKIGLYPPEKTQ